MDGIEGADGIAEHGQWCYQGGVLQTSSDYRVKFDHSWRNQGLISTSAEDIIVYRHLSFQARVKEIDD